MALDTIFGVRGDLLTGQDTIVDRNSTPLMRRRPRNNSGRRLNPLREMVSEQQRSADLARSRQRVEQLKTELPDLIEDQVGEHIQKLEDRLLRDFQQMGQKAIEESTQVLNDHLNDRIETLEQLSAIQSKTITSLRDSSRSAEYKVNSVVDSIERTLAGAVPGGFKLDPLPAPQPQYQVPPHSPVPEIPQPRDYNPETDLVKADPRDMEQVIGKHGYCPSCTSTDVRRAYRSGLFEEFLRLFFIAPFRCRACRHKFYRF